MAQSPFPVLDPNVDTGTSLAGHLNNWAPAVLSQHSGTGRPSYAVAGTIWYDTDVNKPFYFNGSQDIGFIVSSDLAGYLPLTGGTLTGPLGLPAGAPTAANQATRKDYVDLHLKLAGGAISGDLSVSKAFTAHTISANTVNASQSFSSIGGNRGSGAILLMEGANDLLSFSGGSTSYYPINANINGTYHQLPSTNGVGGFAVNPGGGPVGTVFNFFSATGTFAIIVDAVSDERIKQDIRDTEIDALAVISELQVRSYGIRPEIAAYYASVGQSDPVPPKSEATPVPIGFVAQELKRHIPEAVSIIPQVDCAPLPDNIHSVHLDKIVPYLVRAIQQLQEEIKVLKKESI